MEVGVGCGGGDRGRTGRRRGEGGRVLVDVERRRLFRGVGIVLNGVLQPRVMAQIE